MSLDLLLDRIALAHAECLRLQREQEAATRRRCEMVRCGLASGVGAVVMAESLGVSRARIYAMAKPSERREGGHL